MKLSTVVDRQYTLPNVPQGVDDNPLAPFHLDNLGCAIWVTAMVDEARNATTLGGVDYSVFVNPEEIAASDAALQVLSFPHVGHLLSDFLTHILNNHVVGSNVFHCIQSPVMNGRTVELHRLLPLLELIETNRITLAVRCGKNFPLSGDVLDDTAIVDAIRSG